MEQIRNNTYFREAKTCIGAYKSHGEALLVDSGLSRRNAREAADALGTCRITAVFNTHGHADHCGGNRFLQEHHRCQVLAPAGEAPFIEDTTLEATYLFGSGPPPSFRNRFLCAEPSTVQQRIRPGGPAGPVPVPFAPGGRDAGLRAIGLPGHSPDMMGLLTPDGILFLGDALVEETLVERHPLLYTYQPARHRQALETLRNAPAKGYVLAHGGFRTGIGALIDLNLASLDRLSGEILTLLHRQGPLSPEGLHEAILDRFGIQETVTTYAINRTVLMAHLSDLCERERADLRVGNGQLLFRAARPPG